MMAGLSNVLNASPPKKIAVIGGGLSGLASAYFVNTLWPTANISLFEKTSRTGGWINSQAVRCGDEVLAFETGPRSMRASGLGSWLGLKMVRDLDLEDRLITVSKQHPSAQNRFVYYKGRLNKMPSSIFSLFKGFITLPVLDGALRAIIAEPFRPRRPLEREDESVSDFVGRRFGRKIADNLVSAVMGGIYAGDISNLSARQTLEKLYALEEKYGSLGMGAILSPFDGATENSDMDTITRIQRDLDPELVERVENSSVWSLYGGLGTLTERLSSHLARQSSCQILRSDPVTKVLPVQGVKDLLEVRTGSETSYQFDHILSAVPGWEVSQLSSPLLPEADCMGKVNVGVVNLAFRNPIEGGNFARHSTSYPKGFGYLIPKSTEPELNPHKALGVIFDSDMMPGVDENGAALHPEFFKLSVLLGGYHWKDLSTSQLPTLDNLKAAALETLALHLPKAFGPHNAKEPAYCAAYLQQDCIPQPLPMHHCRMKLLHDRVDQLFHGRLAFVGSGLTPGVGMAAAIAAAHAAAHNIS